MKTIKRVPYSPPIDTPWQATRSVRIPGKTGTRTYEVRVGYPCRVAGKRGLWRVIGISVHRDDGRTNIEVVNGRIGASRIFSCSNITYVRPSPAQKAAAS